MKKLGLDEGGRVATAAHNSCGMGYGWDSRGTARVQTRIALTEKQATDNRVRSGIQVGESYDDVPAEIPNQVLPAVKAGHIARIQYGVGVEIEDVDPFVSAAGVPIDHIERYLVRVGILEIQLDREHPLEYQHPAIRSVVEAAFCNARLSVVDAAHW